MLKQKQCKTLTEKCVAILILTKVVIHVLQSSQKHMRDLQLVPFSLAASKTESMLERGQWEDIPPVSLCSRSSSSRKHINGRIIRCTIQCLGDYKVSCKDLTGIIMKTDNIENKLHVKIS